MEKSDKASYLRRHLSQLKIVTRLLEHELDLTKGDEIVLDKSVLESALDTIEIFVEDAETAVGGSGRGPRAKGEKSEGKAQVTRLN